MNYRIINERLKEIMVRGGIELKLEINAQEILIDGLIDIINNQSAEIKRLRHEATNRPG
jgi:uncharacterized coiled-coil protein SlyX